MTDPYQTASSAPLPLGDGGVSVGRHVLSRLSVSVLSYLSSHPGAAGTGVCRGLGVRHAGQIGRVLERLQAKGLVETDQTLGKTTWSLSVEGREVLNRVQPVWCPHPAAARPSPPADPPAPA